MIDCEEADDYLTDAELDRLGLGAAGRHVRVSRHALLLSRERIAIGAGTCVHALATLSPGLEGISIGEHAHVGAYVSIVGRARVEIGDGARIEARTSIFSSNDDYSGRNLMGPTVPDALRGTIDAPVHIGPGAIVGVGSIVMPGVHVGQGATIAPMSFVTVDVDPGVRVAGIPAHVVAQAS